MVSNEQEDLIHENRAQKDKIIELETQLSDYKNIERHFSRHLYSTGDER